MKNQYNRISIELIKTLARMHAVTDDQSVRFFDASERKIVESVLRDGVREKVFGMETVPVPAPGEHKIRAGVTATKQVKIYYLNNRGKMIVRKFAPELGRKIRAGRPTGVHRARLYHELLVVECLLWWLARFKVIEYSTENELKSAGQNPADLRVTTVQSSGHSSVDCEIVVQNKPSDIAQKSDDMLWFTPSKRQADTIDWLKKTSTIVINLRTTRPRPGKVRPLLSASEQEVFDALELKNYPLTAGAVAAVNGTDRAQTSSVLCKLTKQGVLYSAGVHPLPGLERGRPEKLFALEAAELDLFSDRVFALMLSKVIEKAAETDCQVVLPKVKKGPILVTNFRVLKMLFIEDVDCSVAENVAKFSDLAPHYQQKFGTKPGYVPGNSARAAELAGKYPHVPIINFHSQKADA